MCYIVAMQRIDAPRIKENNMNPRQNMSLEQQFELRRFEDQVRHLSREEAQELLIQLRESMLLQANTFKDIIKESWGIGQDFSEVMEG
jgi:hypothetical protein